MNAPASNRLFFAISPPEEARRKIAETARHLRETHRLGGRLIKPARLHMTLFFLGDVDQGIENRIKNIARAIESPPFAIQLDMAGSFNNRQIPIWLGQDNPPPALQYLADSLAKQLMGYASIRPPAFKPHLTIIREASDTLKPTPVEPITWQVSEFVLIHSILHERPARYEIVEKFALRGTPLPPVPKQTSFNF